MFIIFKGLLVARNCHIPKSASLIKNLDAFKICQSNVPRPIIKNNVVIFSAAFHRNINKHLSEFSDDLESAEVVPIFKKD